MFRPERLGQLGVVPDVQRAPSRQPWWQTSRTVWQGFVQAGSFLALGTLQLLVPFPHGPGGLHLASGLGFVLLGLACLLSTIALRRYRRRLADSATRDANPRS